MILSLTLVTQVKVMLLLSRYLQVRKPEESQPRTTPVENTHSGLIAPFLGSNT